MLTNEIRPAADVGGRKERQARISWLTTPQSTAHVVAAIDLDNGDEPVLSRAIGLVRATPGTMLHVLTVVPEGALLVKPAPNAALRLQKSVVEIAMAVGMPPSERFGVHVRAGNAADAILGFADELGAALIMVGDHGRRGLRKWLHKTTSEQVLARAGTGVIVVGREEDAVAEPHIQPPCAACLKVREASRGALMWCEQHARHHPRAHAYAYDRELPFASHDSNNLTPTGV